MQACAFTTSIFERALHVHSLLNSKGKGGKSKCGRGGNTSGSRGREGRKLEKQVPTLCQIL